MMSSAARVPKLGSFRHSFAERKERLFSMKGGGYSQIGITLPEYDEEDTSPRRRCCSYRAVSDGIVGAWKRAKRVAARAWEMGVSDPRKIIFSAKMGLALILLSLLIFLKKPFADISRYSVWAILTVVVVFEFSIGTNNNLQSTLLFPLHSILPHNLVRIYDKYYWAKFFVRVVNAFQCLSLKSKPPHEFFLLINPCYFRKWIQIWFY